MPSRVDGLCTSQDEVIQVIIISNTKISVYWYAGIPFSGQFRHEQKVVSCCVYSCLVATCRCFLFGLNAEEWVKKKMIKDLEHTICILHFLHLLLPTVLLVQYSVVQVIMIEVSLSLTYLSLFQGINEVQHDIIKNVKEGKEGTGGDISHFMVNFKPRSKVRAQAK